VTCLKHLPVDIKLQRSASKRVRVLKSGETPLAYLLAVMRDETADIERHMECAVAAAPYMHAKLKAIEVAGQCGEPIETRAV
jgi:hypothetical protein